MPEGHMMSTSIIMRSLSYNGENSSETYMVRARIGYRVNDRLELVLNAGDEYQKARSLSYQAPPGAEYLFRIPRSQV
ncbi:MAG: hypothetical protein MZV63_08150 [Marinilabiliales bacterium]|nr:hypothetical protein [Marinilabiliales bacterium]